MSKQEAGYKAAPDESRRAFISRGKILYGACFALTFGGAIDTLIRRTQYQEAVDSKIPQILPAIATQTEAEIPRLRGELRSAVKVHDYPRENQILARWNNDQHVIDGYNVAEKKRTDALQRMEDDNGDAFNGKYGRATIDTVTAFAGQLGLISWFFKK